MHVEQFVMAYGVEQDRLRAILPEGFSSQRPVLRINAELRDGKTGYLEFNTAVQKGELRGWLNIGFWDDVPFTRDRKTVRFCPEFLEIEFTGVGIAGGCPAEKDNAGCFFLHPEERLVPTERITANKEFCDCRFRWRFTPDDAHGVSIGKTLPAVLSEVQIVYPKESFTVQNAAKIPCMQVLGTYTVQFEREEPRCRVSFCRRRNTGQMCWIFIPRSKRTAAAASGSEDTGTLAAG